MRLSPHHDLLTRILAQDEFEAQPPQPPSGGAPPAELSSRRRAPNRKRPAGSQDRSKATAAITTINNAKLSCHISAAPQRQRHPIGDEGRDVS